MKGLPNFRGTRIICRHYTEPGYMSRRLEQLAEEARPIKDDPKAGPNLDVLGGRAKLYQKELGNTSLPSYSSKHTQQLAESRAWEGEVSHPDQVLRDRIDSKVLQPRPKPARLSSSQRFAQAREKTLDYQLEKQNEDQNGPSFKELYGERFSLGGGRGTLASIDSLASQRIEDAIAQGKFKNIRRGQKLELPQNDVPWVDQTEYILNEMIKKQGAAPPWIEKQGKVHSDVKAFRKELQSRWIDHVCTRVMNTKKLDQKIQQAMKIKPDEWERECLEYHTLAIKTLNDQIRGYNLQAPSSARKGYLDLRDELDMCYGEAKERIPNFLKNRIDPPQPKVQKNLHKTSDLYREDPSNYYGFMDLCRDLFSKKKKS